MRLIICDRMSLNRHLQYEKVKIKKKYIKKINTDVINQTSARTKPKRLQSPKPAIESTKKNFQPQITKINTLTHQIHKALKAQHKT